MPAYKTTDTKNRITWYASFYYTDYSGKSCRKVKRGFKTKHDAQAWERNFLDQLAGAPSMSFASLAELFLQDRKATAKKTSVRIYTKEIEGHLLPFFSNMPVNAITPAICNKWFQQLPGELSATYKKHISSTLKAMFRHAIKFYGLPKSPAAFLRAPASTRKKQIRFLTLEQFRQLQATIKTINYPYYVFFTLLFYSGMRKGEALALTPADLDYKANTIDINKRIWKQDLDTPKTKASNRVIIMPPQIMAMLQDFIRLNLIGDNNRIFECISYNATLTQLKYYCGRAGLPLISPHDLRHSHASLLISQGVQPMIIKERLGHENIKETLDTYSHLYPNDHQKAADLLTNILSQD